MLYYDRIDMSERIDPTESNRSKESMICRYRFLDHGFKFQYSVCNGFHDLTMLSVSIRDGVVITVKNVDYPCIIDNSKSREINSLEILCLKIVDIYKKILIFSLLENYFLTFLF